MVVYGFTMSDYSQIKIPSKLCKKIDNIIENGDLGYKSRAEFTKDAIRRLLLSTSVEPNANPIPEALIQVE